MSELGKINKMNYNFAKEKDRSKVINPSVALPRDVECVSPEAASSFAKRSPGAWAFTRVSHPRTALQTGLGSGLLFLFFFILKIKMEKCVYTSKRQFC